MVSLASASDSLKVWKFEDTHEINLTSRFITPSRCSCIAWNHTNQVVAAGGSDSKIFLVQANNGQILSSLQVSDSTIPKLNASSVAFSSNSRYLAVSLKSSLQLWDLKRRQLKTTMNGHMGNITSTCFLPTGEVVAGDTTGAVRIWDTKAYLPSPELRVDGINSSGNIGVTSVGISATSASFIGTGYEDGTLSVWDGMSFQMTRRQMCHEGASLNDMVYSPKNPRLIATAGSDGRVTLIDTAAKNKSSVPSAVIHVSEVPSSAGVRMNVRQISFHEDAIHTAVGLEDGRVLVYDWRSIKRPVAEVAAFEDRPVLALAFRLPTTTASTIGSTGSKSTAAAVGLRAGSSSSSSASASVNTIGVRSSMNSNPPADTSGTAPAPAPAPVSAVSPGIGAPPPSRSTAAAASAVVPAAPLSASVAPSPSSRGGMSRSSAGIAASEGATRPATAAGSGSSSFSALPSQPSPVPSLRSPTRSFNGNAGQHQQQVATSSNSSGGGGSNSKPNNNIDNSNSRFSGGSPIRDFPSIDNVYEQTAVAKVSSPSAGARAETFHSQRPKTTTAAPAMNPAVEGAHAHVEGEFPSMVSNLSADSGASTVQSRSDSRSHVEPTSSVSAAATAGRQRTTEAAAGAIGVGAAALRGSGGSIREILYGSQSLSQRVRAAAVSGNTSTTSGSNVKNSATSAGAGALISPAAALSSSASIRNSTSTQHHHIVHSEDAQAITARPPTAERIYHEDGGGGGGGGGVGYTNANTNANNNSNANSSRLLDGDRSFEEKEEDEYAELRKAIRAVTVRDLDKSLEMLRYDMHREVQDIVKEQIRQFSIAKDDMTEMMQHMSQQLAELLQANRDLRAENEYLRRIY